ncbi:MAG TPA: phosphoribosyl-ATP diphosphatase [Pseudomonadales bacterium]|nr:phosphoribosyl-ATP diphosphatase [Pseudomonadales bacterium]HRG50648.1 phosphoribosyl-ATP diphosphatase [Pseudomonadales bacterium]
MQNVLEQLTAVLEARKRAGDTEKSYVASLHAKGLDQILKKVAEECGETLMAAKDLQHGGDSQKLVCETADLWFHTLVLLSHQGLSAQDVLNELARRFDLSGLDEKAARK